MLSKTVFLAVGLVLVLIFVLLMYWVLAGSYGGRDAIVL
ncbi:hypothetical protein DEV91_106118 [Phyllobacterium brassicacearum]|nr:hypothetical protein DEV91_106118 [Phyllobacterium brassicacearum]